MNYRFCSSCGKKHREYQNFDAEPICRCERLKLDEQKILEDQNQKLDRIIYLLERITNVK